MASYIVLVGAAKSDNRILYRDTAGQERYKVC